MEIKDLKPKELSPICPICRVKPRSVANKKSDGFNKTCGDLFCSKKIYFGTDSYINLYDLGEIPLTYSKPSGPRKLFGEVDRFLNGENEFNFSNSHYKVFIASEKVKRKLLEYEDIDKLELSKHFKSIFSFYVKECELFNELKGCSIEKRLLPSTELRYEHEVWWIINGNFSYPLLSKKDDRLKFLKRIGFDTCCKMCSRELTISKWSFDKNLEYVPKGETRICKGCLDTSSKEKFEDYGVKFKLEGYRKQSLDLKRKIEEGTFTPCRRNFVYGGIKYKLKKYRSSWEVVFQMINDVLGVNLEYETQRFPYVDTRGNKRTYISDFYDPLLEIIYEVKPSSETDQGNNILKRKSVEETGLKFEYITEVDIAILLNCLEYNELDTIKSQVKELDSGFCTLICNSFRILRD